MAKLKNVTRYFGYKIEQDVESIIKKEFLSWIKTHDGYANPGVDEMINRCVEEFTENNVSEYDYIITTASSSPLTSIIADKLSYALNIPILNTAFTKDNQCGKFSVRSFICLLYNPIAAE